MDTIDFCLWQEVISHLDSPSFISLRFTCKQIMNEFPQPKLKKSPLRDCVKLGYISLLKWLHSIGFELVPKISLLASKHGNLNILDWYLDNKGYLSDWLTVYAARGGSIDAYQWTILMNCKPFDIEREAIVKGKLEFLKFYLSNHTSTRKDICNLAGYYGHAEMLSWLLSNGRELDISTGCISPIGKNSSEIIKILDKFNQPMHPRSGMNAARVELDALKWVGNFSIVELHEAIRREKIETVKFLLESGVKPTNESMLLASRQGRLDIVKYLYEKGLLITRDVFLNATSVELVKWFLDKGYIIDQEFIDDISYEIDLLKWLHLEGYNINYEQVFVSAILENNAETLKWLDSMGYRYSDSSFILRYAVDNDSVSCLRWLLNNGYKTEINLLELAIEYYCECVINYLVSLGYKSDKLFPYLLEEKNTDTIIDVIRLGHPVPDNIYNYLTTGNQIRWAKDNGFPLTRTVVDNISDINTLRMIIHDFITD